MDGVKKDGSKSIDEGSHYGAVDTNPRPSVVSPPSAPNLTSLLTGHIGQEAEKQAAENGTALEGEEVDNNTRSPIKKKKKQVIKRREIDKARSERFESEKKLLHDCSTHLAAV